MMPGSAQLNPTCGAPAWGEGAAWRPLPDLFNSASASAHAPAHANAHAND